MHPRVVPLVDSQQARGEQGYQNVLDDVAGNILDVPTACTRRRSTSKRSTLSRPAMSRVAAAEKGRNTWFWCCFACCVVCPPWCSGAS